MMKHKEKFQVTGYCDSMHKHKGNWEKHAQKNKEE
jgi:hypothetical protein